MADSNKEVILNFIADVVNGKNIDAIPKYFHKDYRNRLMPYVGLGIVIDGAYQDKMVIKSVAEDGPSYGKIEPGDELVAADDKERSWENYEELSSGGWGQGVVGTPINLTVRRDGELVELNIVRGLVNGFEPSMDDLIASWKHFLTEACPDLQEDVIHIVEEGDMVAVFSQLTGTIEDYKRQAIWADSAFFSMKDGKIIEEWGVGPGIEYYSQLGYKFEQPKIEKEKLPG